MQQMTMVMGIDGCRFGWLCLRKELGSNVVQAQILATISDLLTLDSMPSVVMVDIPIGLTDRGPRRCDQDARRLLGRPRSSSVFSAPIRPMLAATSYSHACQIGASVDGRKLSLQAWGILPKIREVDSFLRSHRRFITSIREVHPELSFWAWNGQVAMEHPKKSAAGRTDREFLVKSSYAAGYVAAQASLPSGKYSNDDLLDAFAALWTAERVATGNATTYPAAPPSDEYGFLMEIVV